MKKFVKLLLAVAIAAPLVGGTAYAQETLKIGYVIKARVMQESKIGKAAAAQLEKRVSEAQKNLEGKAKEIKKMQEDIQRRLVVLSDDEKKKVLDEHERQVRDAERLQEDYQRELQKVEGQILGKVSEHLAQVISDFGKANGYDLIIDASALMFASEKADVSAQIVEAADKSKWKL